MTDTYKALVAYETADGFHQQIDELPLGKLPEHEVLIRVSYSSINFKDALSATGNKGVTRQYPHTPGIDAAGIVVESRSTNFCVGDEVIITGFDLGMNTTGGFGEYIRVPADWIIPLPKTMSLRESMIYGTAGLTAAQGVKVITDKVNPHHGPVVVTGATGGVGSLAVAVLAHLGYHVIAISGKAEAGNYLASIGAAEIHSREWLQTNDERPLLQGKFAAAFDTVGGKSLEYLLKTTQLHGVIACCGNVAGAELHTTVFPFILRGLTLAGLSSQNCPMELRKELWQKLANEWKPPVLDTLSSELHMEDLPAAINTILKGEFMGRKIILL